MLTNCPVYKKVVLWTILIVLISVCSDYTSGSNIPSQAPIIEEWAIGPYPFEIRVDIKQPVKMFRMPNSLTHWTGNGVLRVMCNFDCRLGFTIKPVTVGGVFGDYTIKPEVQDVPQGDNDVVIYVESTNLDYSRAIAGIGSVKIAEITVSVAPLF